MAQGGLHQVNRRAPFQRVRGMGVAQPMGRDGSLDARPPGRLADDAPRLRRREPAALAGAEDRIVRAVTGP